MRGCRIGPASSPSQPSLFDSKPASLLGPTALLSYFHNHTPLLHWTFFSLCLREQLLLPGRLPGQQPPSPIYTLEVMPRRVGPAGAGQRKQWPLLTEHLLGALHRPKVRAPHLYTYEPSSPRMFVTNCMFVKGFGMFRSLSYTQCKPGL